MKLRELWLRTNNWLQSHRRPAVRKSERPLDKEGLITEDVEGVSGSADEVAGEQEELRVAGEGERGRRAEESAGYDEEKAVVVASGAETEKGEPIERLQRGFSRLIEGLENINDNLNVQVSQHKELIEHLDKMPELVKSFPMIVENQEKIRTQLSEQLSAMLSRNEQFVATIGEIPTETAKQTEMLDEIKERLVTASEIDGKMSEGFGRFNETLDKLDRNTAGQTDSIMQMSKTFATSDRYLKYIMSRQNKRFMWLFVISLGVCVIAILTLTGIIIYLNR